MDILLPGISGYDLVRYLRQDERHATLPVLFLTTEGQLQSRIERARVGGDDHLVKPVVPPALLLSAVAARIERARLPEDPPGPRRPHAAAHPHRVPRAGAGPARAEARAIPAAPAPGS